MEELFLINYWIRTLIPLVLMSIAGILTNSLIVNITVNNEIIWLLIPKQVSFYIFIIVTIFLWLYQVIIFKHDKELIKGFTPKQYEANQRNKLAEGIAKRSKKLIEEGNIEQLEKETTIFQKLYGENK